MLSGRSVTPMSAGILALALVLGGTPIATPSLAAQDGDLVDRIVAVVGDSVITLTQLQERLFQMSAQFFHSALVSSTFKFCFKKDF